MKSAIFTRRPLTAAEDPDRTDKYVRFYTFILFNSLLKKQLIKWWKLNSHKSVQIATNWKKRKQNDLFESVSTFSSGGSRRLLLAESSWNEIFISLFYFQKYQNASVRDNIYNAHVGFREWE